MDVFERYFSRNVQDWQVNFPESPETIIVIPVFDDPDIFQTVDSLCACDACEGKAGVIIVVNHSADCPAERRVANRQLAEKIKIYINNIRISDIYFTVIEAFDLPVRLAGVGYARKIGMDAAAAYFHSHGLPDCPIISLDADTWVEPGYFREVIRYFRRHSVAGISIAYEHRLEGPGCCGEGNNAMMKYELYLRYYRAALEYAGHPYAFHCIGSAFAVRAVDYVAQGGMNKRQAGEDFYFLQKLIATGRYAALNTTRVYPSPRFSARTPFGTGQSVRQIVADGGAYPVYNFDVFRLLKRFFAGIAGLYLSSSKEIEIYAATQPEILSRFLVEVDFAGMVGEVQRNCATEGQFIRRFFNNFNAFQVLKFLNYAHQSEYAKIDVLEAVNGLLKALGMMEDDSVERLLQKMRRGF